MARPWVGHGQAMACPWLGHGLAMARVMAMAALTKSTGLTLRRLATLSKLEDIVPNHTISTSMDI